MHAELHTHSEYVTLTAFQLQKWLRERASMFGYTALSVLQYDGIPITGGKFKEGISYARKRILNVSTQSLCTHTHTHTHTSDDEPHGAKSVPSGKKEYFLEHNCRSFLCVMLSEQENLLQMKTVHWRILCSKDIRHSQALRILARYRRT